MKKQDQLLRGELNQVGPMGHIV